MIEGNPDFKRVESQQEIDGILQAMEKQAMKLSLFTDDAQSFSMRLSRIEGRRLFVEPDLPMPRELKSGESIQLLFGLSLGLFGVKTKIDRIEGGGYAFNIGNEVFRQQRRNDFRVSVPPGMKIEVMLTHLRDSALARTLSFQPRDLSAGGLSFKWPEFQKYKPAVGQHVSGILKLPGGREIEFKSDIRSVSETNGVGLLGLRFLNLSMQESQTLLFTCVQIQRNRP